MSSVKQLLVLQLSEVFLFHAIVSVAVSFVDQWVHLTQLHCSVKTVNTMNKLNGTLWLFLGTICNFYDCD